MYVVVALALGTVVLLPDFVALSSVHSKSSYMVHSSMTTTRLGINLTLILMAMAAMSKMKAKSVVAA